ncbi:MAG: hypothetical protein Hens3KO_15470 [Henriciella sp.]
MFALQILAFGFLCLSALLLFGPQLVAYGPKALPDMLKNDQVRYVGGFLTSALVLLISGPYLSAAMVSGGEQITLVAIDLVSMRFSI